MSVVLIKNYDDDDESARMSEIKNGRLGLYGKVDCDNLKSWAL